MPFSRFTPFVVVTIALALSAYYAAIGDIPWTWCLLPISLFLLGVYDLVQTKHSILRNYPVLGHLRYLIESVRPELRQYLMEDDNDAQPYSRAQRTVVYQRSKNVPDTISFGTKINVRAESHEWMGHSLSPSLIEENDFRVLVGGGGARPYSLSVMNISAMSFGSLSGNAIQALNLGAKKGGFAHDTGEGSVSRYHRMHGGDIIWEIGSGYFGCRNAAGGFDPEAFQRVACEDQIKMIEVKLSQGAKPGHGGILPAAKVTQEIAEARGVPLGQDCVSPAAHSEFHTPLELLAFIERLRTLSGGKPTGIKLCVGHPWEFFSICKAMLETNIVPDFIVVDGAEGGTGAAPVEFADHMGMPLQEGLVLVHNTLKGLNLRERIRLGASGKVINAFDVARMLAIGADWVNCGRGFLFSLGCLGAQVCGSGKCPTGVATQDPIRQRALDVNDKAERVFHYHQNTLHALKELLQAAGLHHPGELRPRHIVTRTKDGQVKLLSDLLPHLRKGELLNGAVRYPLYEKWWPLAKSHTFEVPCPDDDIETL